MQRIGVGRRKGITDFLNTDKTHMKRPTEEQLEQVRAHLDKVLGPRPIILFIGTNEPEGCFVQATSNMVAPQGLVMAREFIDKHPQVKF